MVETDRLFQKYGDVTGDNAVGLGDFAAFRQTFGLDPSDEGFEQSLDFDGKGAIGLSDFAAFRSSFGS